MSSLNDAVSVSGPGYAEIGSISELSGELPTEEQLLGIINRIDVQITNILTGNGTYGAATYEETGNVGMKIDPGAAVRNLINARKMYVDQLKDPAMAPDPQIFVTLWDNPGL